MEKTNPVIESTGNQSSFTPEHNYFDPINLSWTFYSLIGRNQSLDSTKGEKLKKQPLLEERSMSSIPSNGHNTVMIVLPGVLPFTCWYRGSQEINELSLGLVDLQGSSSYPPSFLSRSYHYSKPQKISTNNILNKCPPFKNKLAEGCPGDTVVKNPPANAGDMGSSPGLGRSYVPWSNKARGPQLLSLRSRTHEPQLLSPCA